jgi:photosystem II stability/assembly factor-like uncharacterized protein
MEKIPLHGLLIGSPGTRSEQKTLIRRSCEMSRLVLVVALSVFLLAAGASRGATPPGYLVKVDIHEAEDIPLLLDWNINVVQDLGSFVLARAGISDIALLVSAGFSVETLDSEFGYCDHYVVSLERCPNPSVLGKVVYTDSNLAIVRRAVLPFRLLACCDMKKIRTSPIRPKRERQEGTGFLPDTLPDPLIQQMVDSVSADTVENYLRSLEGIGTRYSTTPGCSLAAEYIRSNLEAAGLTAILKPYAIPGMVYDVSCVSDSLGFAVDEIGAIYKTTDGGVTWEEKYRHNRPLLGVCFIDSLTGWSVGGDTVLQTIDGGETWSPQAGTGALELFRCVFVDSLHGWASGTSADTSASVYRTSDGGSTWTCSSFPMYGEFLGISFPDTLNGWTTGVDAGTGLGGIYRTTDGGLSWSLQYDTSNVAFFGITFYDTLKGWAAGGDMGTASPLMLATTDGGQSWSSQVTGGFFLTDVDFLDSLNGWCAGFGTIRHTTNGGTNWTPQAVPAYELLIALDMLNMQHGLIGGSNGAICATFNSGGTWSLSNTGGVFVWYNVEAEYPGVDMADEIYIICGHHDDISEDPLYNAPGADDNASGVACVLEAARIVSNYQFHRTIKFVTFSGEEQGLLGSQAYAFQADSLGLNILGVLNLDMIGFLDDSSHDLEVYCDGFSQWMADTVLSFSSAYVPGLIPYKEVDPGMVYSDHASFWDFGYSAILHIERAFVHSNPYYHSTGDTVGTLDMPYVTEMVKLGVASIAELADPYVVGVTEARVEEAGPRRLSLIVAGSPAIGGLTLRVLNPTSSPAILKIYDAAGRLVTDFAPVKISDESFFWDGTDESGSSVSSGTYFARLEAGGEAISRKFALVR